MYYIGSYPNIKEGFLVRNVGNTSSRYINSDEYNDFFSDKNGKALEKALETRKFEIDLYWRRATYFWTFIGATFGGFFVAYASTSTRRQDLLVILCCLGVVFSFAWFCVNKGSKYWQENWEKHVDLLEDDTIGPLFKTLLTRNDEMSCGDWVKNVITGPQALSVSKINQLISLFVFVLWGLLLVNSLQPMSFDLPLNYFYVSLVFFTILFCGAFLVLGRTYHGGHYHLATVRKSRIKPEIETPT